MVKRKDSIKTLAAPDEFWSASNFALIFSKVVTQNGIFYKKMILMVL